MPRSALQLKEDLRPSEVEAAPPAPRGRPIPATLVALGLGGAAAAACALLAPETVNGDGLGYLRAAPTGALVPGHLGYLPLVRLAGWIAHRGDPLGLLPAARAISLASAGAAVALLFDAARRLLRRSGPGALGGAALAAVGMACSYGALQAGSDVETYAPALAALCLGAWCAVRRRDGGGPAWTLAAAAAVALAALAHVENVVAAPALALLAAAPDRARGQPGGTRPLDGIGLLSVSGAAVLGSYAGVARIRGDDVRGALRWILGAGHGFSYPLHWWSFFPSLHGIAKTLIYAPYPLQAGWPTSVALSLVGLTAAVALIALATRPGRPPTLGRAVGILWTAPYLLIGLAYFGSDNERWVFLLPPAWIAVGAAASTSPRRLRAGWAIVAALLAANLALGLPVARDRSVRDRADRLAAFVRDGDLVISPGHSWDEYIGFYRPVAVETFPVVYYCGLLGGSGPMRAELDRRVAAARDRGARVFLARLDGDDDLADDGGWKDLARFGIDARTIDRWLPAGSRAPIEPGLVRLDPP